MKYCPYCGQMIEPRKHVNWFILMLMCFLTGGFWLILYVPYYFLFKDSACPMCGANANDFSNYPPSAV